MFMQTLHPHSVDIIEIVGKQPDDAVIANKII